MFLRATTTDIPAIRKIAHDTWFPTYGEILSREQINYMLDKFYSGKSLTEQMNNGHQFYLLKENNESIGFIDVEKVSEEKTKLHKIYLLNSHQGKNYGRLLIDFAIQQAETQHSSILQLNVNRYNKALGFYRKMGFHILEEVDIPIGNGYFMNDYVMEKLLR